MDIKNVNNEDSEGNNKNYKNLQSTLEKAYISVNRLSTEIWVSRLLLVSTQKELRNMLSETEKQPLLFSVRKLSVMVSLDHVKIRICE